jgi:site-specific DNA-adenine methylase
MKDIILFGRLGNKTNDIKYFKEYLPLDVKNVVEPFGGTFAVIRNVYDDKKYKKYVNDNDEILFKIYTHSEDYSKMSIEFNNIASNNLNENGNTIYENVINEIQKIEQSKKYDQDLINYWKTEKIIRGRLIKVIKNKNMNHDKFIKVMKEIKFSNIDYLEYLKKFIYKKDTFIFLDPPYLFSDNSQYSQQKRIDGCDMTDILYEILEIFNNKKVKARIMLIINDMKIIRWMFKNYIKGSYDKIYQIAKRKDKHLIITNY